MKRFTHYLRKVLDTGEVERVEFAPVHYNKVGVPYARTWGMPQLEAHELVNRWNVSQDQQRYVYGLE